MGSVTVDRVSRVAIVVFTFLHELRQPSNPLPPSGNLEVRGCDGWVTSCACGRECGNRFKNVSHHDHEICGARTYTLVGAYDHLHGG